MNNELTNALALIQRHLDRRCRGFENVILTGMYPDTLTI